MANAKNKRTAASNDQALKNLRLGMGAVNLLSPLIRLLLSLPPLRHSLFPRVFPLITQILTTGLTIGIWRYFERIGGVGKGGGEDLSGGGVVELGWDVIYITWACTILSSIFGGKMWYFYLAVPAIAIYKTYTFIAPFLFSRTGHPGATAVPKSSSTTTNSAIKSGIKTSSTTGGGASKEPKEKKLTASQAKALRAANGGEGEVDENGDPVSKRQAKLRARMERGDKRVGQQQK